MPKQWSERVTVLLEVARQGLLPLIEHCRQVQLDDLLEGFGFGAAAPELHTAATMLDSS